MVQAWVEGLSDVDEDGLPKSMVRANWIAWALSVKRQEGSGEGPPVLEWRWALLEHDEALAAQIYTRETQRPLPLWVREKV